MTRLAFRLPLIALALAALVAAILSWPAPRPAEASHEVWSGTLTAKQLAGNSYGCNNSESNSANRCSNALTSDSLTIGGQAYRIHTIAAKGGSSPSLKLRLALPSDVRYSVNSPALLTLKIGTNSYIIPNAGTLANPNPGITFTANQQVAMSIEDTHARHATPTGSFDWARAQQVWSATLTVQEVGEFYAWGCSNNAAAAARCDSRNLTSHTFRIGGTTYRLTYIETRSGSVMGIATTPALPELVGGWGLIVRGPDLVPVTRAGAVGDPERAVARPYVIPALMAGELQIAGDNAPSVWSPGESVMLTLYRAHASVVAEDREKPASRSGECGSVPTNSTESAEIGLWHCHGDSVYHRHEDWRAPHQPRPVRAPTHAPQRSTQDEINRGFAPAGWHSHGSGDTYIYHNHRGGHPHCTGDGC